MTSNIKRPIPKNIPIFYSGYKIPQSKKSDLWQLMKSNPDIPTSALLKLISFEKKQIITVRHLNRIRASWGFSRKPGRPYIISTNSITDGDVNNL